MVPLVPSPLPTLIKTKIFISAGTNDQIVSYIATLELVKLFQGSGENIVLHWQQSGHELGKREILEARIGYHTHNHRLPVLMWTSF